MDIARRVLARHMQAAGVIDLGRVEKLRKDLLTLLSNLPRVKTYEQADTLRKGFSVYQQNFDEVFFQRFLNKLKDRQNPSENRLNHYLRKPAWDLYIELSLPLRSPDEYWSEERCLGRFQEEKDAWGKRVKRKAAVFWKILKDEIKPEYGDGTEKPLETYEITRQKMVIEGFQVELEGTPEEAGGEHSARMLRDGLEKMKAALKDYRQRASSTVPWMLKHQLPITLNMDLTLDKGGRYERNHIVVSVSSLIGQGVRWGVQVLAHEMGHHMYRLLPKDAQAYWNAAIREDYAEDLDLEKLLAEWPPSVSWTHTYADSIEKSDPVLSLQLDVLSRGHRGAHAYQSRDDFAETLEKGYKKLTVPKTPISGYGGKDPEEGFCEALGLLVAYGPRTVDQTVLGWLNDVIPGRVKLALDYDRRSAAAAMSKDDLREALLRLGWRKGNVLTGFDGLVKQFESVWLQAVWSDSMWSTTVSVMPLSTPKTLLDAPKEQYDAFREATWAKLDLAHRATPQDIDDKAQELAKVVKGYAGPRKTRDRGSVTWKDWSGPEAIRKWRSDIRDVLQDIIDDGASRGKDYRTEELTSDLFENRRMELGGPVLRREMALMVKQVLEAMARSGAIEKDTNNPRRPVWLGKKWVSRRHATAVLARHLLPKEMLKVFLDARRRLLPMLRDETRAEEVKALYLDMSAQLRPTADAMEGIVMQRPDEARKLKSVKDWLRRLRSLTKPDMFDDASDPRDVMIRTSVNLDYLEEVLKSLARVQDRLQDYGQVERKIQHGPWTLINDFGFRPDEWEGAVGVLDDAAAAVRKAGFGQALYGDIVLEAKKGSGIAGLYNSSTDTIRLNVTAKHRFSDVFTMTHELGHRVWWKVLSSQARDAYEDAYMGSTKGLTLENRELFWQALTKSDFDPKAAARLIPDELRDQFRAYWKDRTTGMLAPTPKGVAENPQMYYRNFVMPKHRYMVLPGQDPTSVTDYGRTNVKEDFAEVFAHHCLDMTMSEDAKARFQAATG